MGTEIQTVADRLASAKFGVVFTGAGISTESGIPDFRSPGGIWTRYKVVYFDEFLASHEARVSYWRMHKEGFSEFGHARPNRGHEVLAKWENQGRLAGVITQNIDGLHQASGSRKVLELHGTARMVSCLSCGYALPADAVYERYTGGQDVPTCERCGGWLKPATVSFGQMLPADILAEAFQWCEKADFFLAVGSSLVVQPAAMMPVQAARRGAFLAIINRDPTPCDDMAAVVIHGPIGETLAAIDAAMREEDAV